MVDAERLELLHRRGNASGPRFPASPPAPTILGSQAEPVDKLLACGQFAVMSGAAAACGQHRQRFRGQNPSPNYAAVAISVAAPRKRLPEPQTALPQTNNAKAARPQR